MCRHKKELRNIDLYVIGSEGLNVCHGCEMSIVEFVRDKMGEGMTAHKEAWKKSRGMK
jgi:hypothetical protein